jgi:hypothetical protein
MGVFENLRAIGACGVPFGRETQINSRVARDFSASTIGAFFQNHEVRIIALASALSFPGC